MLTSLYYLLDTYEENYINLAIISFASIIRIAGIFWMLFFATPPGQQGISSWSFGTAKHHLVTSGGHPSCVANDHNKMNILFKSSFIINKYLRKAYTSLQNTFRYT